MKRVPRQKNGYPPTLAESRGEDIPLQFEKVGCQKDRRGDANSCKSKHGKVTAKQMWEKKDDKKSSRKLSRGQSRPTKKWKECPKQKARKPKEQKSKKSLSGKLTERKEGGTRKPRIVIDFISNAASQGGSRSTTKRAKPENTSVWCAKKRYT